MGRPQIRTIVKTICSGCGAEFDHWSDRDRKFCTKGCRLAFRKTESAKNLSRTCHTCGKVFQINQQTRWHKDGKTINHGKYCSTECKWNDSKARRNPKQKTFPKCIVCEKEFEPNGNFQKRCSHECNLEFRRRSSRKPRTLIRCKTCKKEFKQTIENRASSARYCSRKCQPSQINFPRHIKEKAERFGCEYDPKLKRIDIFERDNWTCQACGVETPAQHIGTSHYDAPELDHIVALSKQGPHRADNVQCLCRFCNGRKKDRLNEDFIKVRKLFPDRKVFADQWKRFCKLNTILRATTE